jgi:hypothetical protein
MVLGIIDREASRTSRVVLELFLSYENGKDIKVVLNFSKSFCFFSYIAKFCISQALVPILAIGLGKKNKKKKQILVIFNFHFKDVRFIILRCFLFFFGFHKRQEITFTMAVAHSCEREKN